jgi:Protein of unknown function (DUF3592)
MLAARLRRLGWIAFALMWIPFIGIFAGMMSLPSGDYSWVELPLIAQYSIVATGIFFVLTMALMLGSPLISGLSNRTLRRTGLAAQATVLSISDTGTTINQNPVAHLKLRVEPGDRPAFEAETEMLLNRLEIPQIQPGAQVAVRYNPNSHAVALDLE